MRVTDGALLVMVKWVAMVFISSRSVNTKGAKFDCYPVSPNPPPLPPYAYAFTRHIFFTKDEYFENNMAAKGMLVFVAVFLMCFSGLVGEYAWRISECDTTFILLLAETFKLCISSVNGSLSLIHELSGG